VTAQGGEAETFFFPFAGASDYNTPEEGFRTDALSILGMISPF
jgi:hypothetical protein